MNQDWNMGKLVLLDYKISDITAVWIEINRSRIYLKTPTCPVRRTLNWTQYGDPVAYVACFTFEISTNFYVCLHNIVILRASEHSFIKSTATIVAHVTRRNKTQLTTGELKDIKKKES